jgi:hypothetical protein
MGLGDHEIAPFEIELVENIGGCGLLVIDSNGGDPVFVLIEDAPQSRRAPENAADTKIVEIYALGIIFMFRHPHPQLLTARRCAPKGN